MHSNFFTSCRNLLLALVIISCGKGSDPKPVASSSSAALMASSGNCSAIGYSGTYQVGKALDATNQLALQVNVSKAGTYSISTNTVNGYSFSGSGTFKTTGIQNALLTGSGTPQAYQSDTFVATIQNSTCSFSITPSLSPTAYSNRIVISTGQPFMSSGYNTYAFDGNGKILWSKSGGSDVAAIRNDTAFLALNGNFVAVNVKTGAQIWSNTTYQGTIEHAMVGTNRIYATSDDGMLYALSTATGSSDWSYAIGTPYVVSSEPTYSNGVIYVGSPDNNVYAINADGTLKWKYLTSAGDIRSSPAVASNIVYVGADNGKLYAVNATTGTLAWSVDAGITGEQSPTISGDKVYVQGDKTLFCLNAASGATIWSYAIPNNYDWSSPSELNGVLYVCGISQGLQTFNSSTGAVGWSNQSFGQTTNGSPTVYGGVAYVAASGGLTAIDAASGLKIWNYGYLDPTSSTITSFYTSPVVYDTQTKQTAYASDSGNKQ